MTSSDTNNASNLFNVLNIDTQVRNILGQQAQPYSQSRIKVDTNYYDIVTLEHINFYEDWDYSLPTIQSEVTSDFKNKRIKDINTFQEKFNERYGDYFSHVDFNNILIAGGSVIGTLLQQNWTNDVDVFLYGLTENQAAEKVPTLITQIYTSVKEAIKIKNSQYFEEVNEEVSVENVKRLSLRDKSESIPIENIHRRSRIHNKISKKTTEIEFQGIRNDKVITLIFDSELGSCEIQIILRIYKSVSEILHGFDMGSVAVGYDGSNNYFTSLGKFSYENLANIVDPTRRSTTYETRLLKYFHRGFQIILPYLDITKLKTDNLKYNILEVASLPYFTFSYKQIKGNKITMDRLLKWGQNKNKDNNQCDYQESDIDEYRIFYLNLRSLVHNNSCGYYHYSTHMDLDILTSPPYISASRIIDYYDSLSNRIYNKSTFNIGIFASYFSIDLLPHILTDIFLNNTESSKLNELIELQKTHILNKLASLTPLDYSLKFLTKNPGTQLSGSFNPIISNPEDWYGSYLQK